MSSDWYKGDFPISESILSQRLEFLHSTSMLSFRLQKSLRPLFSLQEGEKSSFQRYERSWANIESTLWISSVEGFLRRKKIRGEKMLAPPNVCLKPMIISDIWVDIESTLRLLSLDFCGRYTPKKPLSSIKRRRKKLSPSSKKSWFCVGNYATLLSWLLSLVPRLPKQYQVTATPISSLDICRR